MFAWVDYWMFRKCFFSILVMNEDGGEENYGLPWAGTGFFYSYLFCL